MVVAAGLVVGVYALMLPLHHSTATNSEILEPQDTSYSIPAEQFNGIAFDISTTSVVNGTFYNTYGITLYTMTPAQFETFSKTGVVSGYNWTSGRIANNTITNLNIEVPPGAWELAFVNSNLLVATSIGFYSNLTLAPA